MLAAAQSSSIIAGLRPPVFELGYTACTHGFLFLMYQTTSLDTNENTSTCFSWKALDIFLSHRSCISKQIATLFLKDDWKLCSAKTHYLAGENIMLPAETQIVRQNHLSCLIFILVIADLFKTSMHSCCCSWTNMQSEVFYDLQTISRGALMLCFFTEFKSIQVLWGELLSSPVPCTDIRPVCPVTLLLRIPEVPVPLSWRRMGNLVIMTPNLQHWSEYFWVLMQTLT